jgi:ankyrin repeat protein
LIFCARFGSIRCLQLLLGAGADVHARTKNGATALAIANLKAHAEVVRVLLGE